MIFSKTAKYIFILLITVGTVYPQVSFESSNLPIVVINTQGQTIPDEPKIMADMGIIYNGPGERNYLSDAFNEYEGKIGIEIRGSSSQMFPKKQYAVETRLADGENNNVSLLGLPAENDWILHAPYTDKTFLRNVLAYHLSNEIGRYASRTRFCEVVLNGDYQGVYVLMEKIKRDKNRVDISKLEPDEISGDDLTGGYMIKIDKTEGAHTDGWYSIFPPYKGSDRKIFYQYHEPKADEIVPGQEEYIQDYIYAFELKMFSPEFNDPDSGYMQLINSASFVDHFILNEIGKNVDGYRLSAYLYKDKDSKDKRLFAGPIWDFNLAFGNANYYNGQYPSGWQVDFMGYGDYFQIPFWWHKLVDDNAFRGQIIQRWQTLRKNQFEYDRITAYIDSLVNLLDESAARDFERWPRLGQYIWPNPWVFDTWEQEIGYFKNWISDRLIWMDGQLQNPEKQMPLHKTSQKPVIDGWMDPCWNNFPVMKIGNVITGMISDSADLSAGARICWDENNLYVWITLNDDQLIRDSGTTIHNDDGIELYLDLDNSKNNHYDENDFKYRFAWDNSTVYERIRNAVENVQFKMNATDNGYQVEIAIPWATLGQQPRIGSLVGFELQVNDDDDGGERDAKIAWWGTEDNAYSDPSKFGVVRMEDATTLQQLYLNPTGYELGQNYPNPFNATTTIHYHLQGYGNAAIEIFNTAGQKIETLHIGRQGRGRHTVKWHSEGKPSGLYFYRLRTGSGISAVRKMILIK